MPRCRLERPAPARPLSARARRPRPAPSARNSKRQWQRRWPQESFLEHPAERYTGLNAFGGGKVLTGKDYSVKQHRNKNQDELQLPGGSDFVQSESQQAANHNAAREPNVKKVQLLGLAVRIN